MYREGLLVRNAATRWGIIALAALLVALLGATALAHGNDVYYSVVVPKLAGDTYNAARPASGGQQINHTDSVGGGYAGDVWAYVANYAGQAITGDQPLYPGRDNVFVSNVSAGQSIRLGFTTEWWVPVNVSVTGRWHP